MKKSYNYVLVFTDEGAKFVTKVNNIDKTCEWQKLEKPLNFASKDSAQNIAIGLTLNFNFAVAVVSNYEITEQPYNYERGNFVWKDNKKEA